MFIEFSIGFIVGSILTGHYFTKRYEKQHKHCPYRNTGINVGGKLIKPTKSSSGCNTQQRTISGNNINIGSNISVDGDIITRGVGKCHMNVIVEGDCVNLATTNGDVMVRGDVTNSVTTSNGSVEVKHDIIGSVTTENGDIECDGAIRGEVKTTLGDIIQRTHIN